MLTLKAARAITGGGLGFPSKMPGTSYGLPAQACLVGAKLAAIPGSVCHGCYALKGNYLYPNVETSQSRRLASIQDPAWIVAMVTLLQKEYEDACQEFTDLIRKPALLARRIKPSRLKPTGYQSQIPVAGSGLAHSTSTVMAQNRATFLLTLPRSGATVELSHKVMRHITRAKCDAALTRIISRYSKAARTSGCTQAFTAILEPAGLQLVYYMRFHDSGDLQSAAHLAKIAAVASATPRIRHWLPTRELAIVLAYKNAGGIIPPNLIIRVSATMVDGPATKAWPTTSSVHSGVKPSSGRACPAPKQGNKCGDCRACWNPNIPAISYHKH